VTLTRVTNNASCNWVNLVPVSSVQFISPALNTPLESMGYAEGNRYSLKSTVPYIPVRTNILKRSLIHFSVYFFSWGTPLKRQSVWLHTHTPDRLLYKTVGFYARISQKLHMQPSPNIPRMLPLAPAQPALAALR